MTLTKSSFYSVEKTQTGVAAGAAITLSVECNNTKDVLITGYCSGQSASWRDIGSPPTNLQSTTKARWDCKGANESTFTWAYSASAVCLTVP